jgi:excinuclease ABC subunit B
LWYIFKIETSKTIGEKESSMEFKLQAPFKPTGDQPEAIRKLVEGIQKGYRNQVLLGATATGKSLGYKDPVYIAEKHGGKNFVRVVPIGELIDLLIDSPGTVTRVENGATIVDLDNDPVQYFTLAIDPHTCNVAMKLVHSFIRHIAPPIMYRLLTRCGRSITLTGDHNLWVLRDGEMQLIKTSEARPMDCIPFPEYLPEKSDQQSIDTLHLLSGQRLFVESPGSILSFIDSNGRKAFVDPLKESGLLSPESKISNIRLHRRGRGIEVDSYLNLLERTNNLGGHWDEDETTVGGKQFHNRLPARLSLTKEFLRFLGYYLAEGNHQPRYIILANHDECVRIEIINSLKQLGIPYTVRSSSDFQISSTALSRLCEKLCGADARSKHLPEFWPQLSNNSLGHMLGAYFNGDGTVGKASDVTTITASVQLASDLAYALLRFGIWARIQYKWKRATNTNHAGDWYYNVTISGQTNLRRFDQAIGFTLQPKKNSLNSQLGRLESSNVDIIPGCGENLRWLRQELKLSAKAAGEKCGLSRSAVQYIETGQRMPQRLNMIKLLTLLREEAQKAGEQSRKWWSVWEFLRALCQVHWTPIASVDTVEYEHPYVYDLSVPGVETFLAGRGGLFVHNTYTMASIIEQVQKPALVMAHNKTLAAQLYAEFKDFFPDNAVEYFVSYYDYYQPEAYVPRHDLYIEKETDINEEIERLRLAATTSLMSRKDVIVVASVSCIYGIGNPEEYGRVVINLNSGSIYRRNALLRQLIESQYQRNDMELRPGTFRVRGDTLEIIPAYQDRFGYRITFFGDEVERMIEFNAVTGELRRQLETVAIYPAKHFITEDQKLRKAIADIEVELQERLAFFKAQDKFLEAQRLEQRTLYDLEMLREVGYCSGIENYSRHMDQRPVGSAPWTLVDYLPTDYLLILDESHMTVPQIRGMYNGDRNRKETLVEYGFRLPSALDNRPLMFDEFEERMGYTLYTSATPGPYEMKRADQVVEQIIRPTGLVDPEVDVRPVEGQVDDLVGEIRQRVERGERVLVTTLTKRMAEKLADYLMELGFKVHYLHSEIETLERVGILRDLRLGVFDVVVGINLLREGLDLPEVSLVAILDADKEGFLRSQTSLIQTIGRAARHVHGKVIMYADKVTDSMKNAIEETNRRRAKQVAYNQENGIEPVSIIKAVRDLTDQLSVKAVAEPKAVNQVHGEASLNKSELERVIAELEKQMKEAARDLEFEKAAAFRDQIYELRALLAEEKGVQPWEKARLLAGES